MRCGVIERDPANPDLIRGRRRSPPNMKRREDAQGTRVEHTNPHAIGRAASESEIAPATAPVPNGHGTRVNRVGSARPSAHFSTRSIRVPLSAFAPTRGNDDARPKEGAMSQRRTELENAFRQAGKAAKHGDLAAAERWSKIAERLAAAAATVDAAEADRRSDQGDDEERNGES